MATSRSPSRACGRSLRETECCAGPRTRISASWAPLSLALLLRAAGPSNISYLGRGTFRASQEPFGRETAPKFLFYAPRARTFQFHTRPELPNENLNLNARLTDKTNQTHWQRAFVTSLRSNVEQRINSTRPPSRASEKLTAAATSKPAKVLESWLMRSDSSRERLHMRHENAIVW